MAALTGAARQIEISNIRVLCTTRKGVVFGGIREPEMGQNFDSRPLASMRVSCRNFGSFSRFFRLLHSQTRSETLKFIICEALISEEQTTLTLTATILQVQSGGRSDTPPTKTTD